MFSRPIRQGEGLCLVQDRESRIDAAIHMFFVNFDLGVIWLDQGWTIVDIVRAKRWAPFYQPSHPAQMVLEIHPDRLPEFHQGDVLTLDYE